ncbi:MAG: hypothetical protein LAQ30_25855 [Acidobacteriia bacterium]|nr:hypothetical protein [Terriglobia bacterium]
MAIRKETFFEARVFEYWKDAVSDDYTLTAAVRAAGLRVAFAPGALAPSLERTGMRRFFSWGRRQMMITRAYDRRLWLSGLLAHFFYCGGMAASAAASVAGNRLALCALAAQLAPGIWKGLNRARLARAALPEHEAWFRRYAWAHAVFVPLATWAWLGTLICSAFGRTIDWRGYCYRLPG